MPVDMDCSEDNEQVPGIGDLICFALHAAARSAEASYRPALKPFGLTYTQYLVLLVVWAQDGRSVGEIGEALHLDSGTLTPLLKRLEISGWVFRERDPSDERVVRVSLTGKAIQQKGAVARAIRNLGCRLDLDPLAITLLRNEINALRRKIDTVTSQHAIGRNDQGSGRRRRHG